MSEPVRRPLAAEARRLSQQGEWNLAGEKLRQLIFEVTQVEAMSLHINQDQYSLNSLNGLVSLADGRTFFFKYHHEEGEEHTIEEYYRAELLREHGFRVDVPVYACGEPGRQILLYTQRNDTRLADVCREIEKENSWELMAPVIDAQRRADTEIVNHTLPTLRTATQNEVKAEAIHQLFWNRLISPELTPGLGGRVASFYVDKNFILGTENIDWQTLSNLHWRINGITYKHTLRELFLKAGQLLAPSYLANHGVVVAHGDAHNANVWYENQSDTPRLVSFDPAFAGSAIPALLAEIKATFHNIFAHPCWLYEPSQATQLYRVDVKRNADLLDVTHDWALTPLRKAFLESKGDLYWKPLLNVLKEKGLLPDDWKEIMRLALFCCPTLVMNLRAGSPSGHNPVSSSIGFSIAVMLGSEGDDEFNHWINSLI